VTSFGAVKGKSLGVLGLFDRSKSKFIVSLLINYQVGYSRKIINYIHVTSGHYSPIFSDLRKAVLCYRLTLTLWFIDTFRQFGESKTVSTLCAILRCFLCFLQLIGTLCRHFNF